MHSIVEHGNCFLCWFAFVVIREGFELEQRQFVISNKCTVLVAELLCLHFDSKWITEQNSAVSTDLNGFPFLPGNFELHFLFR